MSQIKVELQDVFGSDRAIAEAAWTSSLDYQKKQTRSEEDVKRVVTMLADQKHATPFESVIFRFWIKLPIAIDRQHMTHRIASHNGMSGRYRTMPTEFLEIPDDVIEILKSAGLGNNAFVTYNRICVDANEMYNNYCLKLKKKLTDEKINNNQYKRAREFLRGMLPQHNMTERTTIMNLRSFCNYQKLRNSDYAQLEIKQVAQLMLDVVEKSNACPIAIEALKRNNWNI